MIALQTDEALRRSRVTVQPGRLFRALIIAAGLIGALFATDTNAGIRNDIDSILTERGYQRTLPQGAPPAGNLTLEFPDDFGALPESSLWDAGPAIRLLLWILVGAGIIFLVFHLFGVLSRIERRDGTERQQSRKTGIPGTAETEAEEQELASLGEIERLAQVGAYGDAIHLILLHCIEYLREGFPFARDPALTSREILAHGVLPDGTRRSLSFIVAAVEVGHFGRQQIDKSVYERCLDDYRAIAAPNAP